MNDAAVITCENLVKIYSLDGVEVVALQGLDLTIQKGELLGIVGASGSGKSTLLNVLGGLDRPSAGKVLVDGRDLLKLSDTELDLYRRTSVGFVWQQTTRNLIPYLTALENVELPLRLTKGSVAQRRQRALELLEILGLANRIHRLPVELSGGEQQRVAIAVALANRPLILLADEPTGEVDTATSLEIYAALRKMNQTCGMTTIIVSHDPNLSHHTDRVIAIRDGKTSTEMVRYTRRAALDTQSESQPAPQKLDSQSTPVEFEELVVLDSAGRLQIPRQYLEELNIGDRVRLELKEGSIVIQPVAGRGRAATQGEAPFDPRQSDAEGDRPPEIKLHPLIDRARRIFSKIRLPHRQRGFEKRRTDRE